MSLGITPSEARARLMALARPIGRMETVSLADALGRLAAVQVVARNAVPAMASAAMDGYAVRLPIGGDLELIGAATAAAPYRGELAAGKTVRIETGASVPAGADAVVASERVTLSGANVRLVHGEIIAAARNIRVAGDDVQPGEPLIDAGATLTFTALGAMAAQGIKDVQVSARPRVALMITGTEFVCGTAHDSTSVGVAGLLKQAGYDVLTTATAVDDDAAIVAELTQLATTHDLVLTTGGASSGPRDQVRAALARFGPLAFSGVAMRPGKPVLAGIAHGTPVIGLPGNPASALVCTLLFVLPTLDALAGRLHAPHPLCVLTDFAEASAPHYRFLAGKLQIVHGRISVKPLARFNASRWSGLANSDGVIELAPSPAMVAHGAPVTFHAWPNTLP